MDNYKLYTGGLAETVPNPSLLTYSFLKHWFNTNNSLGRALDILQLPHLKSDEPIITRIDTQLYIDLQKEESVLYRPTIFAYKNSSNPSLTPQLTISPLKIFSIKNLSNTLKILTKQSEWIAHPEKVIQKAQELDQAVSPVVQPSNEKTDQYLSEVAWPHTIAIGMLAEFYTHLLNSYKLPTEAKEKITQYITQQTSHTDWIIQSLRDMAKVKSGEFALNQYMHEYGLRADQDYELATPRWIEQPDLMQQRIDQSTRFSESPTIELSLPENIQKIVETIITLQTLRTSIRKKMLPHINQLRLAALKKYGPKYDFNTTTRELLLFNQSNTQTDEIPITQPILTSYEQQGKGLEISAGIVRAKVKHITNSLEEIPAQTICIFPNASPEFSIQFPKAMGIIFLIGGQTSHGAIVTREYKIPALADANAKNIPDNTEIEINGTTGDWKIIPPRS